MTEDDLNRRVGENVRRLRLASGLSQADLAKCLGETYAQQTVLKIEKGSRPLRLTEAVKIADALGVEVADLHRPDSPNLSQIERTAGLLAAVRDEREQLLTVASRLRERQRELGELVKIAHVAKDFPPELEKAAREWAERDFTSGVEL